jgi:hypothetical protein
VIDEPCLADARLPADDGRDSLSFTGSSGGFAEFCMAEPGFGAKISGIAQVSGFLDAEY